VFDSLELFDCLEQSLIPKRCMYYLGKIHRLMQGMATTMIHGSSSLLSDAKEANSDKHWRPTISMRRSESDSALWEREVGKLEERSTRTILTEAIEAAIVMFSVEGPLRATGC